MQRFVFCATESVDSSLILDGVLLWVLCIRWKISAIVGFELGTQRLRGKELSSVPLSLWSAWAFWMGFYWQLCFIWRKTLTTVGFELRTLNSEIQRFILCATESVESCLGWGVTESFVLYDKKKKFSNGGMWTQDFMIYTQRFYSQHYWVSGQLWDGFIKSFV